MMQVPQYSRYLPALLAVGFIALAPASRASELNTDRAELLGSHRPVSAQAFSPVRSDSELDGVILTFKRSPEKTKALATLIQQQHNPHSQNYKRWVSAFDYGQAFGPSKQDIERVKKWAQANHLTVTGISVSGQRLTLSGTAASLSTAFSSTISQNSVGSFKLLDFSMAPSVPADLRDVVAGVAIAPPVAEPQVHLSPITTTVEDAFSANRSKGLAPQLTMPINGSLFTFVTPHDLAHI